MWLSRRQIVLQLAAQSVSPLFLTGAFSGDQKIYAVGVAQDDDPYEGARRAVNAAGDWPAEEIASKLVIIKTNLVGKALAESGTTTHPEAVRFLIDECLSSGAREIWICESNNAIYSFKSCGYEYLDNYHGVVRLIDLDAVPQGYFQINGGLAFDRLLVPRLFSQNDVFLISAAKLKTHINARVTLSTKNLVGLTSPKGYCNFLTCIVGGIRSGLHERGIFASIVDINRVCRIGYALVEGVWGMERGGPTVATGGVPIAANLTVAGRNPVAVDRVCMQAMGFEDDEVQHIQYASRAGMGPASRSEIDYLGDSLPVLSFERAPVEPEIELPVVTPSVHYIQDKAPIILEYYLRFPCLCAVSVIKTWDYWYYAKTVRTLQNYSEMESGAHVTLFDSVGDDGEKLPLGNYNFLIKTKWPEGSSRGSMYSRPFKIM